MLSVVLVATPSHAGARLGPAPTTTAADPSAAELESLRRAEAELPPGPEGDEAREALLLDIGRAERRRYDATGDVVHLSAAQTTLRQHLELSKRRGTLTEEHRREVEAELAALDNLSGWDEPGPAPAAAVSPTPPAPVVAPPPPAPRPIDPDLVQRQKTATGLTTAGAVFMGLGGATWLFLSVPAIIAAEIAQQRADDGTVIVSESEIYARAERRRNFARTSFWVGLGGVVVGGIMLGVGLGSKARVEREIAASRARATLRLVPTLGLQGGGATLVLRY